jgi:phage terminase large subunit-like protein
MLADIDTIAAPAPEDVEYRYDSAAADAAVGFFARYLRLTKDKWAGRPFVLEPWQANDIVRPLFGWKRPDGTRRYRRCIVFVPRKNGKTEMAAGIGILMLVGDGVFGPEVYAIAKDKDQARIVFDKAAAMVAMSPELGKDLKVFKTAIFSPALQGAIKPLTGNAEGKHGLNASGVLGDEMHEWPDGRLYTTVHQSEAAREQPLEFLISTAGLRNRGYGWEVWEECQKILNGTQPDPDTLVVIYAADPSDNWTDEATWHKANPNLGVSVSLDYLRAECRKAQHNPRLENDFRRYHLNQWTSQSVRWIPLDAWDLGGRRDWRDEADLRGRRCYAGVDLASTVDIAAVVYVFPPEQDGGRFDMAVRYFVPQDTAKRRVERDRVPYDAWLREGALIATPGNVTDYEFILARIMADAAEFDIALLGIDRWNSSHFSTRLADLGFPRPHQAGRPGLCEPVGALKTVRAPGVLASARPRQPSGHALDGRERRGDAGPGRLYQAGARQVLGEDRRHRGNDRCPRGLCRRLAGGRPLGLRNPRLGRGGPVSFFGAMQAAIFGPPQNLDQVGSDSAAARPRPACRSPNGRRCSCPSSMPASTASPIRSPIFRSRSCRPTRRRLDQGDAASDVGTARAAAERLHVVADAFARPCRAMPCCGATAMSRSSATMPARRSGSGR